VFTDGYLELVSLGSKHTIPLSITVNYVQTANFNTYYHQNIS